MQDNASTTCKTPLQFPNLCSYWTSYICITLAQPSSAYLQHIHRQNLNSPNKNQAKLALITEWDTYSKDTLTDYSKKEPIHIAALKVEKIRWEDTYFNNYIFPEDRQNYMQFWFFPLKTALLISWRRQDSVWRMEGQESSSGFRLTTWNTWNTKKLLQILCLMQVVHFLTQWWELKKILHQS